MTRVGLLAALALALCSSASRARGNDGEGNSDWRIRLKRLEESKDLRKSQGDVLLLIRKVADRHLSSGAPDLKRLGAPNLKRSDLNSDLEGQLVETLRQAVMAKKEFHDFQPGDDLQGIDDARRDERAPAQRIRFHSKRIEELRLLIAQVYERADNVRDALHAATARLPVPGSSAEAWPSERADRRTKRFSDEQLSEDALNALKLDRFSKSSLPPSRPEVAFLGPNAGGTDLAAIRWLATRQADLADSRSDWDRRLREAAAARVDGKNTTLQALRDQARGRVRKLLRYRLETLPERLNDYQNLQEQGDYQNLQEQGE